MDSAGIGLSLATGGAAGMLGAQISGTIERLVGTKRSLAWAWLLTATGFLVLALSPLLGLETHALYVCQILFGLGMGMKLPIELTYRNRATPHHLRGRMNAYIRTLNWGVYSLAAVISGLLAETIGITTVIAIGSLFMMLSTVLLSRAKMQ